jgi:DNA-directed RNA polymerase specialized sigma24 family protein
MAGLVEGDREVLRLVMLEERDTEEVARILRTTREQVHLRKCRALKRLRKLCSVDTAGTETSVLVEEGR